MPSKTWLLTVCLLLYRGLGHAQNEGPGSVKQGPRLLVDTRKIIKPRIMLVDVVQLSHAPQLSVDDNAFPKQYVDEKTKEKLNGLYSIAYDVVMDSEGSTRPQGEFADGRFTDGYYDGTWVYYTYQGSEKVVLRKQRFTRGLPQGTTTTQARSRPNGPPLLPVKRTLPLKLPVQGIPQLDSKAYAHRYPKPPTFSHFPPVISGPESTDYIDSDHYTVKENGVLTVYTRTKTGQPLHGLVHLQTLGYTSHGDVVNGPGPTSTESGRLLQGLQHGKWKVRVYGETEYTETYRRGTRHGPFVALDSAGRPAYRTTFTNGTGYFKRFHRNGRVAYEVLFWHNQAHGWAYTYAPDGTLMEETVYQHGQVVRTVKHKTTER